MSNETNNSRRFKVYRTVNIMAPEGPNRIFYEVYEIIVVDGEEKFHRNPDLAFASREEAEAWVKDNTGL